MIAQKIQHHIMSYDFKKMQNHAHNQIKHQRENVSVPQYIRVNFST